MRLQRSAGVLLHPTSFPGPDGIGDVGPQAYRWVDWLAATGCTWWQLLPLGPTGYGDSPYQCFSAFAGNPLLISAELLLQDGLLTGDDLKDRPEFPADRVDFGPVIQWKLQLLDRAYERYLADSVPLQAQFEAFQAQEYYWLSDFALFMSIKEAQGGVSWEHWPKPLRMRAPQALKEARQSEAVQRHAFRQFLFFKQWNALREYAHAQRLRLIGDIPIFVAFDSADAWSHSVLFYLDE
jgi:4-alpha-glucanotransferase